MSEPTPPRHSTRETRLLLITLAVSVVALLLLARFRFPERQIADLTPPQPLTRLTRVTAFDELSALLRDLLRQFEGAVVTVRVLPADGPAVGALDALALVVRDDIALVPLASGSRLLRVAGSSATDDVIVARDDERGLAAVRLPGHSAPELQLTPAATPVGAPGYVAILEATPEGPTIRAEFVSRVGRESHPGWDVPVLALGGAIRTQPGTFLFTLNGRFIGMTLGDAQHTLVVPAEALLARAGRLAQGESIRLIESGLGVQPMTSALATATGAPAGIVVNMVHAAASSNTAASAATLEVGDAIVAVNGQPIGSPRDWQEALRARGAGATIDLAIVRLGKRLQASWTLPRADAIPRATAAARSRDVGATAPPSAADVLNSLGLSVRAASGERSVEVMQVHAATPGSRAGFRVGDVITSLPARGPATQQSIATAYTELTTGRALLLAITREGTPLVLAVEKP